MIWGYVSLRRCRNDEDRGVGGGIDRGGGAVPAVSDGLAGGVTMDRRDALKAFLALTKKQFSQQVVDLARWRRRSREVSRDEDRGVGDEAGTSRNSEVANDAH